MILGSSDITSYGRAHRTPNIHSNTNTYPMHAPVHYHRLCFKTPFTTDCPKTHFRNQLNFLLLVHYCLCNASLFFAFFKTTIIQVLLLIYLFSHADLIHLLLSSRTSLPHFSELWGTPERFILPHLGSYSESAIWCLASTLLIPSAKRSGCFNLFFFFSKH